MRKEEEKKARLEREVREKERQLREREERERMTREKEAKRRADEAKDKVELIQAPGGDLKASLIYLDMNKGHF